MADAWTDITRNEQLAIARELGAIMATVYTLPTEQLAAVEQQFPSRNEQNIKIEEAQRTADIIKSTEALSIQQRDNLLRFLYEEAPELSRHLAKNHAF